jgi:excisionase family DNA binding protein
MKSSNATPPVKRIITIQRASKMFDIPYSTLRQWIRENRLPAYRIAGGRQVRVYVEDLEALFVRIGGDD